MVKVLVTGGAGYIGSHVIKLLLEAGFEPVILDNLSSGHKQAILGGKLYQGDIADREILKKIFSENRIDAVIHLAALIDAAESVREPEKYQKENFEKGKVLLDECVRAGIKKFIFSSTAAVYGNPKYIPIDERHPTNPTNPYGESKLAFEKYLTENKSNINYIILRYFNVGGSDPEGKLGKDHLDSSDLLNIVMKVALGEKDQIEIFGTDYETKDGTPIRDFIHVIDIASAHILALEKIENYPGEIFNLGSENGFTVKEIIDTARKVTNREIPTKIGPRREGDIAISVASSQKAKEKLGWQTKYSDLKTIIRTDWQWRKNHLRGYQD